ncbi:uncharacterized protein LOC141655359 [Silene latifolia]|uniref:uncharacterized protein LOC141655359 n=1 Tax=Silene latifolia TaxID=37657 RepID=UPI003D783F68
MKIASWNVRGFNCPVKHSEIKDYLLTNKIYILAVLETRVKSSTASKILRNTFKNREGFCNYEKHFNGRIWILFNPKTIAIMHRVVEAQFLTCKAHHHESQKDFTFSCVYRSNDVAQREELWSGLRASITSDPWIVLGDFNVVRCPEEKLSSTPPVLHDMVTFNSCLSDCQLDDISSTGYDLTWNNKQEPQTRVWCKLDRALVNPSWLSTYPASFAIFQDPDKKVVRRFSFLNSWIDHPDYIQTVQKAWKSDKPSYPTFRFFDKLKNVKHALTLLHKKHFSNISIRAKEAKKKLLISQQRLNLDPYSEECTKEEKFWMKEYCKFKKVELNFFQQRAKIKHIQSFDSNTKFFFAKISERYHQQVIWAIKYKDGVRHHGIDNLALAFEDYYKNLLGQEVGVSGLDEAFPAHDDLMIFTRGNVLSIRAVKETLLEFARISDLRANVEKTSIYFGGVSPVVISAIKQETWYSEGSFPFRYLGLPLNTSRLIENMFDSLITKIQYSIQHWTSSLLSYAGKAQLINTVDKGGFNIKELVSWNRSLPMQWVWKLSNSQDSLWTQWHKEYILKQEDIWTIIVKDHFSARLKGIIAERDGFIAQVGFIQSVASWVLVLVMVVLWIGCDWTL